jgi:hypothetical protein
MPHGILQAAGCVEHEENGRSACVVGMLDSLHHVSGAHVVNHPVQVNPHDSRPQRRFRRAFGFLGKQQPADRECGRSQSGRDSTTSHGF